MLLLYTSLIVATHTKHAFFVVARDPADIPWGDMGVDYVIDSTGVFTTIPKAEAHIQVSIHLVLVIRPCFIVFVSYFHFFDYRVAQRRLSLLHHLLTPPCLSWV